MTQMYNSLSAQNQRWDGLTLPVHYKIVTSTFRYSYSIKVTCYSYKLLKKVTCYSNEVTCNLLLPNTGNLYFAEKVFVVGYNSVAEIRVYTFICLAVDATKISLRNYVKFEVQVHPMSSTLMPIESAHTTSY